MPKLHRILLTVCALTSVVLPSVAQGPPPVEDPLGPDLFIAIRENRTDDVRALLQKGAKTESKNWLGMTALMWAALIGNDTACAALIDGKANVKADSIFGTALENGVLGGNPRVIRLLLDHGATFSKERVDKITAVMTAADQGHTEILKMLLAAKPDVNAVDEAGMTALMHASRRGQLENAKLLIDAGAKVNAADTSAMTPLHYAALNGHTDVARLLLSKGAKVNAIDQTGSTPLLLTARYNGIPQLAALLIKSGARTDVKDATGKTACELAVSRGYVVCAKTIKPDVKIPAAETVADIPARAHKAVLTSLDLIQRTTKAFTARGGCFSCHHQGLGLATTGTARAFGYRIDSALAASEQKLVTSEPETKVNELRGLVQHPEAYKFFPAVDMQELVSGVSTTYCGLAAHDVPKSESLGLVATIMARQQTPDGAFHFTFHREPLQSSQFMTTAYAVRTMKTYMPDSLASERDDRIAKALGWLQKTPAVTNEDRAFKLLGLRWAGASQEHIDRATTDIVRTQKPDGGWAQFNTVFAGGPGYDRSDAYATGESLYALYVGGGIKPDAQPYRKGVQYLLRTQDEDGSWFVNKRAVPANNWYDTGFPHGESQYISYSATCWSTMALMFAADKSSVATAAR